MCVKFPSRNLNSDPFLPHPTNIYIYKVTIVPKLHNSKNISIFLKKKKHTVIEDSYVAIIACNYANCQSKQLIMEDT